MAMDSQHYPIACEQQLTDGSELVILAHDA